MHKRKSKLFFVLSKKAAVCFLAVTLCFQSYSAQAFVSSASVPVEMTKQPIALFDVRFPKEFGSIKEKFEGPSGKVVFIIQDAHAIPDAQRSIQKLIEFSEKEYGVGVVALEGASSDLDTQFFRSFPDKELLKKVFSDYFERGELTGGSAAALFSEFEGGVYQGMEDWELYQEGLGYFLDAMRIESKAAEQIRGLFEELQMEKEKTYSKQLLSVDEALRSFHLNAADLLSVLEKLALIEPPEEGSELALLLGEMGRSKENDIAVEIEVKNVAEQIRTGLMALKTSSSAKEDLTGFNQKFQEFQTAQVPSEEFALFLKELSIKHRIRVRVSKRLNARVGKQRRMKDIEGTKLFDDFEGYAKSVKKSLFRGQEERVLDRRSHLLELIERLIKLELNCHDWDELKTVFVKMDARIISQDGVDSRGDAAELLRSLSPHADFYHNAEQRDRVFMSQAEALLKKHGANAITLVAGGFHSEGITELLRAKGISYVLIMPEMRHVPDETSYRGHMEGQVTWGEYFEVENGKVNLYNAFLRGTRDKLLASSVQRSADRGDSELTANRATLKSWRDQIIRDLADQNKITEASRYTRFIDELAKPRQLESKNENSQNELITQWRGHVDRFITGLRRLHDKNQLTEQSLANLLPGSTISDATTHDIFARNEIRVGLIPNLSASRGASAASETEGEARSEVRNMSRRVFLGAAAVTVVAVIAGISITLEALQDTRQENIALALKERAKRQPPSRIRPWDSFKSNEDQPYNEKNIRHDLLVTFDWLTASGYPHADALNQFAGALEHKITIDDQMEAPMRKEYDPRLKAFKIVVNPRELHKTLVAVKEARSIDVFIGSLAWMAVREAWGLEMTHRGYIDRGDEAGKSIKTVDEDRKDKSLSARDLRLDNQAFSNILETHADKISESRDLYFSMEVYEALREWEFLDWAQTRGLYDAQRNARDFGRLKPFYQRSLALNNQTAQISLQSRGQGSVIVNNQLRGLTRLRMPQMSSLISDTSAGGLSGKIVIYSLFLAAHKRFISSEVLDQAKRGRQPATAEYQSFADNTWQSLQRVLEEMESTLPEQDRLLPVLQKTQRVSEQNRPRQETSPSQSTQASESKQASARPETPEEKVDRLSKKLAEDVKNKQWPQDFEEKWVPNPEDEARFQAWMDGGMEGEAPLQSMIREWVPRTRSEVRSGSPEAGADAKVLNMAEAAALRTALSVLGITVQDAELNALIFTKKLKLENWFEAQLGHADLDRQAALTALEKIQNETKVLVGMRIFKHRLSLLGESAAYKKQLSVLYDILKNDAGVNFNFQDEVIYRENEDGEVSVLTKLATREQTPLPAALTRSLDQWVDASAGVVQLSGHAGSDYETEEILFGNETFNADQILFQFDFSMDENNQPVIEKLPQDRRYRPFQKHEGESPVRKIRGVFYVRDNRLYLLVGDLQGNSDSRDPVAFYRNFSKIGQYLADQLGRPIILDQETVILKGRSSGLGLVQIKPAQSLIKRLWIRDIQPLGSHVADLTVHGIDHSIFNHYQGRFDSRVPTNPSEAELDEIAAGLGVDLTQVQRVNLHRAVEKFLSLVPGVSREQIIQNLGLTLTRGHRMEPLLKSENPQTLLAVIVLAAVGNVEIGLPDVKRMQSSIEGDRIYNNLGRGIAVSYWMEQLNRLPRAALDQKREILDTLTQLALQAPFFAPHEHHHVDLENYLKRKLLGFYKNTGSLGPEEFPDQFENPKDAALAAKIAGLSIRHGTEDSDYQKFLKTALRSSAEALESFIQSSADQNELVDRLLSLSMKKNKEVVPAIARAPMLIQESSFAEQNQAELRQLFDQQNLSVNARVIVLSLMRQNKAFLLEVIRNEGIPIHVRLIALSHHGLDADISEELLQGLIEVFDQGVAAKVRFREAVKDEKAAPSVLVQSQSVAETIRLARSMGALSVRQESLSQAVEKVSLSGGIYFSGDYVTGDEINNANSDYRVGNDLLDQMSLEGVGIVLRHEAAHNFSESEIPSFKNADAGADYDTFFAGVTELVSNLSELSRLEELRGRLSVKDVKEVTDLSFSSLHEKIILESQGEGHAVSRAAILQFIQTHSPEGVSFRQLFLSVFEHLRTTAYDVSDRPELDSAKSRVDQLNDLLSAGFSAQSEAAGAQVSDAPRQENKRSEVRNVSGLLQQARDENLPVGERLQVLGELEAYFTDQEYAAVFPLWHEHFQWADARDLAVVLEALQESSQEQAVQTAAKNVRANIIDKMGPRVSTEELSGMQDEQVSREIHFLTEWSDLWNLPLSLDQIRPYAPLLLRAVSLPFANSSGKAYGWLESWERMKFEDPFALEDFLVGFSLVDVVHRESALRLLKSYLARADQRVDDRILSLFDEKLRDIKAFPAPPNFSASETAKREQQWDEMTAQEQTGQAGFSMVFDNLIGAGPYNLFDFLGEKLSEKRLELALALVKDAEREAEERQTHDHTAFEDKPFPHVRWDSIRGKKAHETLGRLVALDLLDQLTTGWGLPEQALVGNDIALIVSGQSELAHVERNQVYQGVEIDPKFLVQVYTRAVKNARDQRSAEIAQYALEKVIARSEVRLDRGSIESADSQAAVSHLVDVFNPEAVTKLSRAEVRAIYQLSRQDLAGLIQTMLDRLDQKTAELNAREGETQTKAQSHGVEALRGVIDLARSLLTEKPAEELPGNITFAIHFSPSSDSEAFLAEIIKGVSAAGINAEVLSDGVTHQSLSKKITQALRSLFRLKKLTGKDLKSGPIVIEEGLGVVTALDDLTGAEGLHEIFQGLLFNREGMAQDDPDLQLAGQILFATFLIKLAVISALPENKNKTPANRAEFLKAALIRAIQEAGYPGAGNEAFAPQTGRLISIMGNAIMNALIQDMRTREEVSQAA